MSNEKGNDIYQRLEELEEKLKVEKRYSNSRYIRIRKLEDSVEMATLAAKIAVAYHFVYKFSNWCFKILKRVAEEEEED